MSQLGGPATCRKRERNGMQRRQPQLGNAGSPCDVSPPSRSVRSVRGSPAPASPFWQPLLTRRLFLAAGCDRIGLIAPATAVCPNASSAFCPEQEHFPSRDHGGTHTPAAGLGASHLRSQAPNSPPAAAAPRWLSKVPMYSVLRSRDTFPIGGRLDRSHFSLIIQL
ncbi:uncharacterized protein CIMG_06828 [Coccidioides immitis RS]|uniref:Uncharacterized protein n=1 Tax=Coccidioides immitis (strain RS) TaxID=246410 RepID=J3K906_COCIM|nr:uncharacterized protein CIMG_06828 [Coccidioides immitis RS]EAS31349.3 hypothetical protein CIMG_06828 [Coccidioides immitis RS]